MTQAQTSHHMSLKDSSLAASRWHETEAYYSTMSHGPTMLISCLHASFTKFWKQGSTSGYSHARQLITILWVLIHNLMARSNQGHHHVGFLPIRKYCLKMCQAQETMEYLNIIRNPVGFLVTFEQLILDLLNLDKPVGKHFQAFILQIKQVAQ
jgi:hypothetical protein